MQPLSHKIEVELVSGEQSGLNLLSYITKIFSHHGTIITPGKWTDKGN